MANFIITEEQYKRLMKEQSTNNTKQLDIKVPVQKGNTPAAELKNKTDQLNNFGFNSNSPGVTYTVTNPNTSDTSSSSNNNNSNSSNSSSITCSRVITKKELTENHFNQLKQNSKLYTVKDFLRK